MSEIVKPCTLDMLEAVRADLGWRIAWAAKNDDSDFAGKLIRLMKAIDDLLAGAPAGGHQGRSA